MVNKKKKKRLILQFSIVILLAFFYSGCGIKAPPRPPAHEKPPAATMPQGN